MKMLHISQLALIHAFNHRDKAFDTDPKKEQEDLYRLFVPRGWKPELGMILTKDWSSEDDRQNAVLNRQGALAMYAAKTEGFTAPLGGDLGKVPVNQSHLLRSARLMFCGEQTGKVIVNPIVEAYTCYRRLSTLININAILMALGLDPIEMVPTDHRHHDSMLGYKMDQIVENTLKNAGVRELSWIDLVKAAKEMTDLNATQQDLKNNFEVGTGQKLWWIIRADNHCPEVGLVDDILKGNTVASKLRYKPLKDICDLPKNEESTAEALTLYVGDTTKGNAKKIAGRPKIEAMAANNQILICRDQAQAIIDDKLNEFCAKYNKYAEQINAITHPKIASVEEVEAEAEAEESSV